MRSACWIFSVTIVARRLYSYSHCVSYLKRGKKNLRLFLTYKTPEHDTFISCQSHCFMSNKAGVVFLAKTKTRFAKQVIRKTKTSILKTITNTRFAKQNSVALIKQLLQAALSFKLVSPSGFFRSYRKFVERGRATMRHNFIKVTEFFQVSLNRRVVVETGRFHEFHLIQPLSYSEIHVCQRAASCPFVFSEMCFKIVKHGRKIFEKLFSELHEIFRVPHC